MRILIIVTMLLMSNFNIASSEIVVDSSDGEAIKKLLINYGLKSQLHRVEFIINNSKCPIVISESQIKAKSDPNSLCEFDPKGKLYTKETISALEIRFMFFDAFKDFIYQGIAFGAVDLEPGEIFNFKKFGEFSVLTSEIRRHLYTVTYVSKIRYPNGNIWRIDKADFKEICRILKEKGLNYPTARLLDKAIELDSLSENKVN